MPKAQFFDPVHNLIIGVDAQTGCHGQIILPGGQDLTHIFSAFSRLPFQVIADLHRIHPIQNKLQGIRGYFFLHEPLDHRIVDQPAGRFFPLEPYQGSVSTIPLAETFYPLRIYS